MNSYQIYIYIYTYIVLQKCTGYDHMMLGCRNMALDKETGLLWAYFTLYHCGGLTKLKFSKNK